MSPRYHHILVAFLLCVLPLAGAETEQNASQFRLQALAGLPQTVHGAFVGTVAGRLVFAGGYQSVPTDGNWQDGAFSSLVQYLDPLPELTAKQRGWSRIRKSFGLAELEQDTERVWNLSELTVGTAFGASTTHGNFLYGVGGITAYGLTDVVFRLVWTGQGWEKEMLPPLPRPVALSGASVMGNRLYVVGGIDNLEDPRPLNHMWVLDLRGELNPADPGLWQSIDLPHAAGIVRPTLTVRRDEVAIADALYILGGLKFDPASGNWRGQSESFKYLPPEQSMAGWFALRAAPESVLIQSALPIGPAHVMLTGRQLKQTSVGLYELLRPYGYDADAWLGTYHVFTNQWVTLPWPPLGLQEPFALNTGGGLVFAGLSPDTGNLQLFEGSLVFREKHFSNWDYLAPAFLRLWHRIPGGRFCHGLFVQPCHLSPVSQCSKKELEGIDAVDSLMWWRLPPLHESSSP